MLSNFRTYHYALDFYRCCQEIKPKNRVIKDQFERASLSVVLNIAEGSGRLMEKDRRRFYGIALGPLKETLCLIDLLTPTLSPSLQYRITEHTKPLIGSLYNLIKNPGCLKLS